MISNFRVPFFTFPSCSIFCPKGVCLLYTLDLPLTGCQKHKSTFVYLGIPLLSVIPKLKKNRKQSLALNHLSPKGCDCWLAFCWGAYREGSRSQAMAIFDVPHILPIAKVPGSDQSAITKTMPLCKDCQENMPRSASHLNQNTEPPPPTVWTHVFKKKTKKSRFFGWSCGASTKIVDGLFALCGPLFFLRYCPQGLLRERLLWQWAWLKPLRCMAMTG